MSTSSADTLLPFLHLGWLAAATGTADEGGDLDILELAQPQLDGGALRKSLSGGNSSRQQRFVKKVSCKEVVIGALHGPSSCGSAARIVYQQLARVARLASGKEEKTHT